MLVERVLGANFVDCNTLMSLAEVILFARITTNCITFHNPHASSLQIKNHYPFTFESFFLFGYTF